MASESVDIMVEGGKASAAPPLGPALGPLGVNIGQVVADINKKTADFKGMKVPVKVSVDKDTKEYEITIGTPPASALIKKEANVARGAGNPLKDKVADLKIEQVIKIAKMKADALLGKNDVSRVKEICGTCDSMGIKVEGKQARETIRDINNGTFVDKIKAGKTELTADELKLLESERKALEEEMKKKHDIYEAKANDILKKMEGKPRNQIKTAMTEAEIPPGLIEQFLPAEEKAAPAAEAKPAANAKKK